MNNPSKCNYMDYFKMPFTMSIINCVKKKEYENPKQYTVSLYFEEDEKIDKIHGKFCNPYISEMEDRRHKVKLENYICEIPDIKYTIKKLKERRYIYLKYMEEHNISFNSFILHSEVINAYYYNENGFYEKFLIFDPFGEKVGNNTDSNEDGAIDEFSLILDSKNELKFVDSDHNGRFEKILFINKKNSYTSEMLTENLIENSTVIKAE